jgi:hypothetical protein
MTELDLLNRLASGEDSFDSNDPDLERIDGLLQMFGEDGIVLKVVRTVRYQDGKPHLERVHVIGGLNILGELRRRKLANRPS